MQLSLDIPDPLESQYEVKPSLTNAPFGLTRFFEHCGTYFKWPLAYFTQGNETVVPLRNGEFASFLRKSGKGGANQFWVAYRYRAVWIVNSNGYVSPGMKDIGFGHWLSADQGQAAHDFLGTYVS